VNLLALKIHLQRDYAGSCRRSCLIGQYRTATLHCLDLDFCQDVNSHFGHTGSVSIWDFAEDRI
jgi:hypothetical protein